MESSRWTDIYEGINMHLQKAYNTNKASFKAKHWKVDPQTGTYDVEAIRRARPKEITVDEGRPETLRRGDKRLWRLRSCAVPRRMRAIDWQDWGVMTSVGTLLVWSGLLLAGSGLACGDDEE
ncbi:hypothetical protein Tco_0110044 [Tanacetum coccineum]